MRDEFEELFALAWALWEDLEEDKLIEERTNSRGSLKERCLKRGRLRAEKQQNQRRADEDKNA